MRRTSSILVAVVLALLSLGIVILASASSVKGDDPQYFLKRQLAWLTISLFAGLGVTRFDYHLWRRLSGFLAVISVILLAAVFVPGLGAKIGGSFRWIKLGPITFQPSEAAKFSMVVVLATWLNYTGQKIDRIKEGFVLPMAGLGVLIVLLMLEPDYGTTALVAAVCMAMLFVAGTRLSCLSVVSVLGAFMFIIALMHSEVRWKRMMAFMHPDDPEYAAKGYHLLQSKIAFISGGMYGTGLGNSLQKHLYLPEAHTDFIFAIIGEELGFIASLAVVAAFMIILICGMIISFKASDPLGRLLAFGFTIMIVLQAFINIAVVTGCAPTKGIALPFISYGGSSLLISIVSVGVILNIAGHTEGEGDVHIKPIKDRIHRF